MEDIRDKLLKIPKPMREAAPVENPINNKYRVSVEYTMRTKFIQESKLMLEKQKLEKESINGKDATKTNIN